MAYNITITNGQGSENILNGNYSVSSTVAGYDDSTILPSSVDVVEGTNEYAFTVAATGTLTIHVTEEGTVGGTPIVGAKLKRTDSLGNEYGDEITTDENGSAVLNNVPWDSSSNVTIYYKQTSSDGDHEFSDEIRQINLSSSTGTVEIQNTVAVLRTITLTDANYAGLPLNGEIDLM